VTPELTAFLSDLDMFYLGTSNAEGQPYIQYRGGSPGFLKVVDGKTLGFADFGGNRQYVTLCCVVLCCAVLCCAVKGTRDFVAKHLVERDVYEWRSYSRLRRLDH